MTLRTQILLFLSLFGLVPLIAAAVINLPLVLDQLELFYHKAYLQNLRADFRDLDQHITSRHESVRLLAKLPEPGIVLGESDDEKQMDVDLARAQYTEWVNQILQDQLDIIQIVFLDQDGRERFWLERNAKTLQLEPIIQRPAPAPAQLIDATLQLKNRGVHISPLRVDSELGAEDPRKFMNLRMISPIFPRVGEQQAAIGAVLITLDVGGIAQAFGNTLWLTQDGKRIGRDASSGFTPGAFDDYPGLRELFEQGKLALWKGGNGEQIIWVPLLPTEDGHFLWVGRHVDPSPMATFQNALVLRVLGILFALAIIVWLTARWVTRHIATFGQELTEGISRVLKNDDAVKFSWGGPQELHALGDNLTRLAETHAQHNQALVQHAQELEESNKYKSEFLANVSHELRTPLNSILLLSKMLSDSNSGLPSEQLQKARVIHEASTDLRSLIDNILDLSRIEAKQATFTIDTIDVEAEIRSLINLMLPQFEAKSLYLELIVEPQTPATIDTDSEKLRQIIKNFLANAVKFTGEGGVTIELSPNPDPKLPLRISVRDTGIGIAAENQASIFSAFKQADGSTSRKYGGTGLGLTISQELAHLIGGRIALQSESGHGSTFSLLLPPEFPRESVEPEQIDDQTLPRPAAPASDPVKTQSHPARSVLVVDRDVGNLVRLTNLLKQLNVTVHAAGDGQEALETLEEEECGLILIDVILPDTYAYDTIIGVRENVDYASIPVIGLLGDSARDEQQKYLDAGISAFVDKPADAAELQGLLDHYMPTDEVEHQ